MLKKLLIPLIILFCIPLLSQGFKKEKRIYMLDITKSMWGSGGNQNIFDDVKKALYAGVEDIKDSETVITVIPFQATHTYEALPSWTFKASDKNKFEKVKEIINSYTLESVPGGYTDIYSALAKAKEHIDSTKVNYIFLLTDGEQSIIPSATKKTSKIDFNIIDLKNILSSWCNFSSKRDTHLFYVMLSKAAVNESIVDIVNKECNAYAVNGTNMNIAFVRPSDNKLKVNIHDNPSEIEINLEANNWTYFKEGATIKLDLENNLIFKLVNSTVKILNKKLIIKLKNKNNLSFDDLRKASAIETKISLTLSTDEDLEILNPNINIVVKNKKEKILTLEFSKNE